MIQYNLVQRCIKQDKYHKIQYYIIAYDNYWIQYHIKKII